MTAIDFPNSPTVDDLFTVGDRTWKWTGSVWITVEEAVVGPAGVVASDSEPTSTDVLWLDTDEEPDVPVPAGGTDGQVLTKTSSADYATAWEDIPEGTTVISSATAPEDTGAIWYDTENGNAYIYYDGFWTSITGLPSIPVGGTTGQILAKSSNTDYATQWVAPGALTLISSTPFTSTTTLDVDNVFTTDYDAYKIIIGVTSSTVSDGTFQLRVSGTTATSNYNYTSYGAQNSIFTNRQSSQASAGIFRVASNGSIAEIIINNPFLASTSWGLANSYDSDGYAITNGFNHTTATSYTGFRLNLNNSTGTVRVYGLGK
jgi:hypothetical protein